MLSAAGVKKLVVGDVITGRCVNELMLEEDGVKKWVLGCMCDCM